jgi:hypothetical protein
MKRILLALLVLIALALGFVAAIGAASHFGGELVRLHTRDAGGVEHTTPLWVVDHDGFQYLRAGDRSASWFERLSRQPEVDVERGGRTAAYRAVPQPELTRTIDELMARKYGLADRFVGVIRNPENSVAVRLVPAS